MNNDKYLKLLKKFLSALDKPSRDDILRELQSHAEALGDNETLYAKFGAPEDLAKQYLEDEREVITVSQKVQGLGKKLLISIGITAVVVISGIYALIHMFQKDDFNYANEQATQLSMENSPWQTRQWTTETKLEVDQSQIVLYWNDRGIFGWYCKNSSPIVQENPEEFRIVQSQCLLSLPRNKTFLQTKQSSIVVVRPQADLQIEMSQSSLRIAENETSYRYVIDKNRSVVDGLISQKSADLEIKIKANESSISQYSY